MTPEADAGTLGVTGNVVHRWAMDVLREWLPGISGTDADLGAQFRITYLGPAPGYAELDRYQVSTLDRTDPRIFRLIVIAMEEQ